MFCWNISTFKNPLSEPLYTMFTRWVQEKIKNAMSSWLIFLFFRQSATENARITSGRPVTDQIESKLHNIIKLYKNFLSGYMIGFIHRPRPPLWAAGFTFGEYGSQKVRYEPHSEWPLHGNKHWAAQTKSYWTDVMMECFKNLNIFLKVPWRMFPFLDTSAALVNPIKHSD